MGKKFCSVGEQVAEHRGAYRTVRSLKALLLRAVNRQQLADVSQATFASASAYMEVLN